MPTVPTVDAPTQQQSGAPLGISAPAEAFGASVLGQGLGGIGQSLQGISDEQSKHAEQYQLLNNKTEADQAFVAHLQAVNQFAADYQTNNRGMKAADNLPAALTSLDDQRNTIANTMSNPMARALFDADSRRATANITGELARFAASQRKESIMKTSVAVQEALASDSVIHLDHFDGNMKRMMEQQVAINDQLGLSPEAGALEARKLYGSTVAMISTSLAGQGDVEAASKFLEDHKEGMDGKVYAETVMKLKPALLANDAASMAHEAVQDALHGINSPVGPSVDYLTAVHGREGDGKNPHSTAEGVGQFTDGRFLDVMKKNPEFTDDIKGKTDAQILAMRHDPAVANRAILANAQMNADYLHSKNLPVNGATVGMAHGYGPGGAEALLKADPNAKVDDIIGAEVAKNNGVSGQKVSQVIQGFQTRFPGASVDSSAGGNPTSVQLQSRMQSVLALVDAKVQAKYGDNAVIRDQAEARAMSELNRQITAAKDMETNAYTTLGSVAMDSQVQDLPTLLKTVPNGLQMYNTLPLSQRTALQADIHRNATEVTAGRQQNIITLNGMYAVRATNPQAFLNADITNLDLPLPQKLDFLKKQQELRGKPASQTDPNQKLLTSIQNSEQYKAIVAEGGLNIKPKSQEEFLLLGNISGQLDAWNAAHPTQAPGPKDVSAMIAHAAGQQKFHYTLGGVNLPFGGTQQNYEISNDERTKAVQLLTKLGRPTDEYNVARIVGEFHARGAK